MRPLRAVLIACLSLAYLPFAMAVPVWAEPVSLKALSDYLTNLKQVETTFTQLNDDGSLSSGVFQLKRPGKMRFEYDPPDQALVVAGANALAIIDKRLGTAEQYGLRRTPLKLLLDRKVDLTDADIIVGHGESNGLTTVTVFDPKTPEAGTMDLIFSPDPITLKQWQVRDDSGAVTMVLLDAFNQNVDLPLSLFNVPIIVQDYEN
ncbi:MAG: LolA family protein [Paracoccaceae bacterium]